jgi:asparagine synthase (glutamine-hydrolysing)
MCGILGGVVRQKVDPQRLKESIARLHHRGPDSRGSWQSPDGRWFLGHTRLSIIGLDNGKQPMASPDGYVQMAVNGEFYGYRELRKVLREQGYNFATESDSEVALHLYQRDGMQLCRHLRGEFAVLIADRRNGTMMGIRDRFGIKPLFYAIHEGNVYFASEIKSLLALGVPARWQMDAVMQEAFMFRPHGDTLFAGIHSVPPGHYAIARQGEVLVYPYWDQEFPTADSLARDTRTDDEVVQGFRAVLEDAVTERLVADVEVASYLSGGIDSCAVLGLAQQHLSKPIRAFTLTFDDDMYDESSLAQQQAKLAGSEFHPIPVTTQALADAYSDAVWHAETPFVNGHGVAKYLLSRAVRDVGIKVVFTGEGADEMLGGYPPFRRDVLLYNSERQDPETVEKLLHDMNESNAAVRGLLTSDGVPPDVLEVVQRRLGWVPSWIEVFAGIGTRTSELFSPSLVKAIGSMNPYDVTLDRLNINARLTDRDPLNQALYLWSRIQLPNFILTFLSDRMEMAHSIEGRVPFLDHRVAEFSANVPIHMKISGMREKHVLREATRGVIIDAVYNREKHPFTTPPIKTSGSDAILELMGDTFASTSLDDQPIFDPAKVRSTFAAFGDSDPAERMALDGLLNRVLSMTLMHQRFGMSA